MRAMNSPSALLAVLALGLVGCHAEDFQIVSKPLLIEATLGQIVKLPCEYKGRPENTYRLWFFDQNVISVDEKIIYRKEDFSLEGSNLIVNVSKPELADKYICKFNDPRWSNVTHTILLLGPPVLEVDPVSIDIREGGSMSIHCKSQSAPKPTITYSKLGSDIDLSQYVKDGILQIANVTRKHAGVYQCYATNGHSPDAVRNVTVKYEGRPDVSVAIQWSNLNSKNEKSVEITCKVASENAVKVQWRKGGSGAITNSKGFSIIDKSDISTLRINPISEDLFDNYTCEATNSYGIGSDTVEISSLPIKPIVDVMPGDVKADLNLTTVSPYRVTKFVLELRSANGKAQTFTFPLSENEIGDEDGKYSTKQSLPALTPDSEYTLTVFAYTENNKQSPPTKMNFRTYSSQASSGAQIVSSLMLVGLVALALRA